MNVDSVRGANPREHAAYDRQPCRLRRDERSDLREHDRERDLSHVRRLPAHVRARDNRDRPARQRGVVRDELRGRPLDDRVSPAVDLDARVGVCAQLRTSVVGLDGDRRE